MYTRTPVQVDTIFKLSSDKYTYYYCNEFHSCVVFNAVAFLPFYVHNKAFKLKNYKGIVNFSTPVRYLYFEVKRKTRNTFKFQKITDNQIKINKFIRQEIWTYIPLPGLILKWKKHSVLYTPL